MIIRDNTISHKTGSTYTEYVELTNTQWVFSAETLTTKLALTSIEHSNNLTLGGDSNLIYTGSGGTWNLPSLSNYPNKQYYIKNGGSGNLVVSAASPNYIFDRRDVNHIDLLIGESVILMGGTKWWAQTSTNVPATLFVQTATTIISNTTSELTLFSGGVGSLVLPANYLTQGKNLSLKINGLMNEVSTPTVRFKLKFGGSVIYDTTPVNINSLGGTNKYFEAIYEITCRAEGTNGLIYAQGKIAYVANSGVMSIVDGSIASASTINTTINNAIDFTLEWGVADVGNNLHITNAILTLHK